MHSDLCLHARTRILQVQEDLLSLWQPLPGRSVRAEVLGRLPALLTADVLPGQVEVLRDQPVLRSE